MKKEMRLKKYAGLAVMAACLLLGACGQTGTVPPAGGGEPAAEAEKDTGNTAFGKKTDAGTMTSHANGVIRLEDYYSVDISGCNGYGTAKIQYNEPDFLGAIVGAMYDAGVIDQESIVAAMAKAEISSDVRNLLDTVRDLASIDRKENLANGDVVTLSFHYDNDSFKNSAVRFEGDQVQIQVSDLPEAEEYDLFQDVEFQFSGYSGGGSLAVDGGRCRIPDLKFEVTPASGLMNGDEVQVEAILGAGWDESRVARELGLKAVSYTHDVVVTGLLESVPIDPFGDLDITYAGTEPLGKLEIFPKDKLLQELVYVVPGNGSLSNGDTVTIHVEAPLNGFSQEDVRSYCAKQGYLPERTEMELTVVDFDSWLQNVEDIPEEDLERMKETAELRMESDSAAKISGYPSMDWYQGMELVGVTCLMNRDPGDVWGSMNRPHNQIYLLYRVDMGNGTEAFSYYFAYRYREIIRKPDGTLQFNTDDIYAPTNWLSNSAHYYNGSSGNGYSTIENFYQGEILPQLSNYVMSTDIPEMQN